MVDLGWVEVVHMRDHDKEINSHSTSLIQYYGEDLTPIIGMVHDMIKAYAADHTKIILILQGIIDNAHTDKITLEQIGIAFNAVILPLCDGFPETALSMKSMLQKIKLDILKQDEIESELVFIRKTASLEAEKLMLFPVDSANIDKYNSPLLFGSPVKDKFPDANQDIIESGNCYALRQPTACILHLMRALESSLKTFAQNIAGFTLAPKDTMGMVLNKLQKLAQHLPDGTSEELEIKKKVHKSALHFHDITEAIRNEAMHTGAFYSMEEANTALVSAKLFLNDLASLIKPPGVPNVPASQTP